MVKTYDYVKDKNREKPIHNFNFISENDKYKTV